MYACTCSPVQNMGHLCHGGSLASPNHVLKYGFLTAKGTTGGVSFDAPAGRLSIAEPAATAVKSQCMRKYVRNMLLAMLWNIDADQREGMERT